MKNTPRTLGQGKNDFENYQNLEPKTKEPWVKGAGSQCSQKPMCNFWIPQNLTTNCLLFTSSLTDNKELINTYFVYVLYTIFLQKSKLETRKYLENRKEE